MSTDPPPTLVVLVGPQASGKSTIAAALAQEWRGRGETVALVELDQIAAMALPTLPSWDVAAEIFAEVTGRWLRSGPTQVIAEGIASQQEVAMLLARIPPTAVVLIVAMTTPFEAALPRAQTDPTRGSSRDRDWLAQRHLEWSAEIDRIPADLLLDAGAQSVERCVALIDAATSTPRAAGT